MIGFTVKIAGCVMEIRALFPETAELFRDYRTGEPPQMTVVSDENGIAAERRLLLQNSSLPADALSEPQLESNLLYRQVAEQLSAYRTVLLHGSAVAVDGEAFVFVAPSGTGKSTHTRLWREVFGSRAVMINDDKPLLKCTDHGIEVCGSPWNGKHRLGADLSVPLTAVCFLERGAENRIAPLTENEAFLSLLPAIYHSNAPEREAHILQSLQFIRKNASFYRLRCNMDPAAAAVSYEGMKKRK